MQLPIATLTVVIDRNNPMLDLSIDIISTDNCWSKVNKYLENFISGYLTFAITMNSLLQHNIFQGEVKEVAWWAVVFTKI